MSEVPLPIGLYSKGTTQMKLISVSYWSAWIIVQIWVFAGLFSRPDLSEAYLRLAIACIAFMVSALWVRITAALKNAS